MQDTIKAWKEAGQDLGIEVESPFILHLANYPIFVRHFGSNTGTIIIDMDDADTADEVIPKQYYWSAINPINYRVYDRDHFIDTLEDWGWFGPDSTKPSWYGNKFNRKKQ